jgi:hypothetical protein
MKPRIYFESSFISFLTARPSRDVVNLARQQFTRDLWEARGQIFEAFCSVLVIEEISLGDADAAGLRLAAGNSLPMLAISPEAEQFAQRLIESGAVPKTEPEDALHIAVATIHKMDYIASWNFSHMVGATARLKLQLKIQNLGWTPPIIATAEEIFEELGIKPIKE